jgi:hypothetical protein
LFVLVNVFFVFFQIIFLFLLCFL